MALATFAVCISTLAYMAVQHLHFSTVVQHQQAARNLAESALNLALLKVLESPNQRLGSASYPGDVIEFVSDVYPRGSFGAVTFQASQARARDLPLSLNNLFSDGVRTGFGQRQVPVNTLHLVAQGRCGGVSKNIEMLFYVPPFPNALASEGPIRSTGGLLVAGVKNPDNFPGDYQQVPERDRAPAHVMSNSLEPRAVVLGSGARIEGNVGAVGGVVLEPGVLVTGAVRPQMEPQALPRLDLDQLFATLSRQQGKVTLPSTYVPSGELSWNAECPGNLHVQGDLSLAQGVLFVQGDLIVDGGIRGEGAVFVQGRTHIRRGASLQATDQVALVSRGRILLEGLNKNSFFFQGLLYSEAEVVANRMTVLGAVVARGTLELNDVNLINAPVTISLVEGMELLNHSDDDTILVNIRVEERDSETRQPLSYRVLMRGYSDDARTLLGPPVERGGLRNYDEIKEFMRQTEPQVSRGYAKNSYMGDWFWNASAKDHSAVHSSNPLRKYLDVLEGKEPDPEQRYAINLNPNEVLGVLERSRVLLWREVE